MADNALDLELRSRAAEALCALRGVDRDPAQRSAALTEANAVIDAYFDAMYASTLASGFHPRARTAADKDQQMDPSDVFHRVPDCPERSGWHWLGCKATGEVQPAFWDSQRSLWNVAGVLEDPATVSRFFRIMDQVTSPEAIKRLREVIVELADVHEALAGAGHRQQAQRSDHSLCVCVALFIADLCDSDFDEWPKKAIDCLRAEHRDLSTRLASWIGSQAPEKRRIDPYYFVLLTQALAARRGRR